MLIYSILCMFILNVIHQKSKFNVVVPNAGNSWILKNNHYFDSDIVTKDGIRNWSDGNQTVRTFFYLEKQSKIKIGIRGYTELGKSVIKVQFGELVKSIEISSSRRDYECIDFQIQNSGYHFVDLIAISKEGSVFANIDALLISTEDTGLVKYIKDDFYFGRRGPSVHLRFNAPEAAKNVEWFYSEIMVPKGEDVIGSYFMANGFAEGYFGIQVNSETERRVLFSIWSPFKTDKPAEVPEDFKIKLLKKGTGVTSGEFGDEGSGGQSYKVFSWKSGLTYRFLIGAKPDNLGSTDFIAYFYDPETNNWNLIAQFRRPKTTTYLTHLYSFLENFIPFQGVFDRKAFYQNQWVYGNQNWYEINQTTFTVDATARKEFRLDYTGGIENNRFYLKNCGFSNDRVLMNSKFERLKTNTPPNIDFNQLE